MPSDPVAEEILAKLPDDVRAGFARVDGLVLDVDGVLTDGGVQIDQDGVESLTFNVRDGSGLWMLHKAGVRVAVVTGRTTGIPEMRAGALRADCILGGRREKAGALAEVLSGWGLAAESCAYVGDDLLDAPALRAVGMAIAVPSASPEILRLARYVTRAAAGRGAVREVADLILAARGDRAELLERLMGGGSPER